MLLILTTRVETDCGASDCEWFPAARSLLEASVAIGFKRWGMMRLWVTWIVVSD